MNADAGIRRQTNSQAGRAAGHLKHQVAHAAHTRQVCQQRADGICAIACNGAKLSSLYIEVCAEQQLSFEPTCTPGNVICHRPLALRRGRAPLAADKSSTRRQRSRVIKERQRGLDGGNFCRLTPKTAPGSVGNGMAARRRDFSRALPDRCRLHETTVSEVMIAVGWAALLPTTSNI